MLSRGDFLKELVIGAPITGSVRDRLISIYERSLLTAQENEALKIKCVELEQRCAQLQHQSVADSEADTFIERHGAKFRRLDGGEFERKPYCPRCQKPMTPPQDEFLPYRCAPCHFVSSLKGFDVPSVLEELQRPVLQPR
jgi:hypothetical protein